MLTTRRGPSLRLRVLGTPIRISWSFPVVIIAFGLLGRREPGLIAAWMALVTISVLVHEGGHVAALRAFGIRSEVTLMWLGGLTTGDEHARLSPWRSIAVSVAGPAAGLSLGLLIELTLFASEGRFVVWLATASWLVNIWWSLLNLLPITPLDGGHVVREFFIMASRAGRVAMSWFVVGLTTASVALVVALDGRAAWFVGIVAMLMFATNLRFLAITDQQRRIQAAEIAHDQLLDGELESGIGVLLPLAMSNGPKVVNTSAFTTLGWALLHERRFDELMRLDPNRFHPEHRGLLDAAVAWYRGDLNGAYNVLSQSLASGAIDPPDGYFRRVFGRLGELDRLTQWIGQLPHESAVRASARLHAAVASY